MSSIIAAHLQPTFDLLNLLLLSPSTPSHQAGRATRHALHLSDVTSSPHQAVPERPMLNPMVTPDAGHIVLASYGLVCVRVCVHVLRSPSLTSTAQMRETCGKHLGFPSLACLPLVFFLCHNVRGCLHVAAFHSIIYRCSLVCGST